MIVLNIFDNFIEKLLSPHGQVWDITKVIIGVITAVGIFYSKEIFTRFFRKRNVRRVVDREMRRLSTILAHEIESCNSIIQEIPKFKLESYISNRLSDPEDVLTNKIISGIDIVEFASAYNKSDRKFLIFPSKKYSKSTQKIIYFQKLDAFIGGLTNELPEKLNNYLDSLNNHNDYPEALKIDTDYAKEYVKSTKDLKNLYERLNHLIITFLGESG